MENKTNNLKKAIYEYYLEKYSYMLIDRNEQYNYYDPQEPDGHGSYTIDYPAVITLDDINNQAKGAFQEIIEDQTLDWLEEDKRENN